MRSRFGRTFAGEPDRTAAELAADEAVQAGILATLAAHNAPAIGWAPTGITAAAGTGSSPGRLTPTGFTAAA